MTSSWECTAFRCGYIDRHGEPLDSDNVIAYFKDCATDNGILATTYIWSAMTSFVDVCEDVMFPIQSGYMIAIDANQNRVAWSINSLRYDTEPGVVLPDSYRVAGVHATLEDAIRQCFDQLDRMYLSSYERLTNRINTMGGKTH